MTLVLVIVVLVVLVFVVGLVAPRKSRRMQAVRDRLLRRGEHEGDEHAGILGDAAEGTLEKIRHAGDRSAEAGRRTHYKLED